MPAAPVEKAVHDGLAYALFMPEEAPRGAVAILHGASSNKESHHDFAALCAAHGLAALAFDARGHGESEGALDGRAVDDVAGVAAHLRARTGAAAIGLRGSSMGGYLALVAAEASGAAAVVAICPASAAGLRRGLADGNFSFRADAAALDAALAAHDEGEAAARLGDALLLMHAEGDEVVPLAHSRALHERAPGSELVVQPGGHHRSVAHDPECQALMVAFLARKLGVA